MALFVCSRCGKCCQRLGDLVRAQRQLSQRDYYCRNGITNELFLVHVQPEYAGAVAEAYEDQSVAEKSSVGTACIFLQEKPGSKGYACAIYPSRPPICRDFRCYRMLIYRQVDGKMSGKVVGKHDLRTEDDVLNTLWKEEIEPLPCPASGENGAGSREGRPDEREWVNRVLSVLAAHGYRGDQVED